MKTLVESAKAAKAASLEVAQLGTERKNEALRAMAKALVEKTPEILAANEKDMTKGRESGMPESLLDRLMLNVRPHSRHGRGPRPGGGAARPHRARDGRVDPPQRARHPQGPRADGRHRASSTRRGRTSRWTPRRWPSRPAARCSCAAAPRRMSRTRRWCASCASRWKPPASRPTRSAWSRTPSHETVDRMLKLREYIDLIVPRGGARLINNAVMNSTVPVLQTGTGNCHVYVDKSADYAMAEAIVINAKTQRTGVCNAAETLLVQEDWAEEHLKSLLKALTDKNVELHGDEAAAQYTEGMIPATEADWAERISPPRHGRQGRPRRQGRRRAHKPLRHQAYGVHSHGRQGERRLLPAQRGRRRRGLERPPRASRTASSSASARSSASRRRSSTPAARSALRR